MRKILALALALALLPAAAFGQAGIQVGAGQVVGNSSAARAVAKAENVTAILDRALGSTRGSILERGASSWGIVAPSATAGLPWVSNGAGNDPAYQVLGPVGGGTGLNSYVIGDIIYASGASTLSRLADVAVGNALIAGGVGANPSWGKITSAHLNITTSTCTNQFVTAISATGTATCTTDTLASAQHANQGTTTTVLHGNAAGNPSWAAVANADMVTGAANTVKGTVNGTTTSDLTVASCSIAYRFTQWVSGTGWQCGISPVLPTRTIAAGLNLSAFSAISTQGYASGGDGGDANFYIRNTAVLTYTLTLAGSCGNGTWTNVQFTGGSGTGFRGTVVCAGGVATSVTMTGVGSQGNGYTAGNVLTASCSNIGSCTVAPQVTVNTVGNGTFYDAFTATFSTAVAGSSCTNGTYYGQQPSGGVGSRVLGIAVISGGSLSSFTLTQPGGGYRVGDQLTLNIPGCVTQPVIQVATNSTPLASFTDSAGNAWQYSPGRFINIRQFGAVADAISGQVDANWTDNGGAIRAALQFAGIGRGAADVAGGSNGNTVFVPAGAYKVCNGLSVYEYTTLRGAGFGASSLKQCDADSPTANFVNLGDPASHVGNFEAKIWDITLFGGFNSGTAYMIYSNNSQSGDLVARVAIYGVSRGCILYDNGYGGQSEAGLRGWLCVINPGFFSGGTAVQLSGNFGFSIDGQSHISVTSGSLTNGVRVGDGGFAKIDGLHCEGGVVNCVSVNGTGASPPKVSVLNGVGPATSNFVQNEAGSPLKNIMIQGYVANSTPCLLYDATVPAQCVYSTGDFAGLAGGGRTTTTMTIASGSGSLTSANGSLRYIWNGKQVFISLTVNIVTNGTGATNIGVTALPFTFSGDCILNGRAKAGSGKALQGYGTSASSGVAIYNYDNTYPGATGEVLVVNGVCEAT